MKKDIMVIRGEVDRLRGIPRADRILSHILAVNRLMNLGREDLAMALQAIDVFDHDPPAPREITRAERYRGLRRVEPVEGQERCPTCEGFGGWIGRPVCFTCKGAGSGAAPLCVHEWKTIPRRGNRGAEVLSCELCGDRWIVA